jgi:peptidoglycan/xylan/chitin deacetylase (PgdA/CDA1 family)
VNWIYSEKFARWAERHMVRRASGVTDRFALTFDDGPSRTATPRVLDALAAAGARATFFTLAHNVRRLPALARRMKDEGHEIAAHGDLHLPPPLLPRWGLRVEVQRSIAAVVAAAGPKPRHYRPPFGVMTTGQAAFVRGLGLEPVIGDVYPEDPHRPGTGRIVKDVVTRLCAGSIVILHDGCPLVEADRMQTVEALGPILAHAARAGLRSVTLDELLADT